MQHFPLRTLVLAAAAVLAGPALAQQGITVVNFGGANGAAQKKAFVEAYEKSTGTKITTVEYNGEQARIKAMVEAKKVTWDVVEVEGPDISRGCDEGLFERLDWSKLGSKSDCPPPCMNAAWAPSSGPPYWPTTATSSRTPPPAGPISGT